MKYIYSSLTCDQQYACYAPKNEQTKERAPVIRHVIGVKGGANVKKGMDNRPNRAVTALKDASFDLIKDHPVFIRHVKRGFIHVSDKELRYNATPLKNMEAKDKSYQRTAEDTIKELNKNRGITKTDTDSQTFKVKVDDEDIFSAKL